MKQKGHPTLNNPGDVFEYTTIQHGTTSGLSPPKKAMSNKASMNNSGSSKTNPREREAIMLELFNFLLMMSKKSQPPNANIVKNFKPKSAQDQGAPAWNTPNSHIAPGTEEIKDTTVIQKSGIAMSLVPRVIHPTVETNEKSFSNS